MSKSFYVTFGQVHTHSINGKTFDKDSIAEIEAETMIEARKLAFELFGNKWANIMGGMQPYILAMYPRGIIRVSNRGDA